MSPRSRKIGSATIVLVGVSPLRDRPEVLVFLDIDGVLNSTTWAGARPVRGFIPPRSAIEAFQEERIDPATVARLRVVVERTGASIVVMSSWRNRMAITEFARLLELHGWVTPPVLGVTPDLPGASRGEEVRAWLEAGDCRANYICLDDDADFLPDQPHIQTDPDIGLTDDDVRRCIARLANPHGRQNRMISQTNDCSPPFSRAERSVAAQDAVVQSNLGVVEITLDDHPSDEFWIKPGEPVGSAARIPDKAVDDRSSGRIDEHLGWRRPTTQFTGICRCGHRLEDHHNGGWLSAEYLATMPQGTRPLFGDECEYYGCAEEGGLGPDLRVHCLRYVDQADPDPPDPALPGSRGTFTRTARAWAWARFGWKAMQVKLLRRDPRIVWRRERW